MTAVKNTRGRNAKRRAAPVKRQGLTVPEAGEALGIGRNAAYRAVALGQIPALRLGRRLIVPIPALERLLAETE